MGQRPATWASVYELDEALDFGDVVRNPPQGRRVPPAFSEAIARSFSCAARSGALAAFVATRVGLGDLP